MIPSNEGADQQQVMTLATHEFIRRFLLHGFHRIRHYGLLAGGSRKDRSPANCSRPHLPP